MANSIQVPSSFLDYFRDSPDGGWLALLLADIYKRWLWGVLEEDIPFDRDDDPSVSSYFQIIFRDCEYPDLNKLLSYLGKVDCIQGYKSIDPPDSCDSYIVYVVRLHLDHLCHHKLINWESILEEVDQREEADCD